MKPKVYDREDSRPMPKKEKEKIPEYYQLTNRNQCVPCFMYIGPNIDNYEEAQVTKKELKYRKIRIKGCQIAEIKAKIQI